MTLYFAAWESSGIFMPDVESAITNKQEKIMNANIFLFKSNSYYILVLIYFSMDTNTYL